MEKELLKLVHVRQLSQKWYFRYFWVTPLLHVK